MRVSAARHAGLGFDASRAIGEASPVSAPAPALRARRQSEDNVDWPSGGGPTGLEAPAAGWTNPSLTSGHADNVRMQCSRQGVGPMAGPPQADDRCHTHARPAVAAMAVAGRAEELDANGYE